MGDTFDPNELTQLFPLYDKDGDGELSLAEQDEFKNDLKKQLKEGLTQLLFDYDQDRDGKLSTGDQRQFLEDLQKFYAVDLSEEMAAAEAHPEGWQQVYEEAQQAFAAEAQEEKAELEMLVNPEKYNTVNDSQPSYVTAFVVAAITGAALTTVGIQIYLKKSRRVGLKDNCALLSA